MNKFIDGFDPSVIKDKLTVIEINPDLSSMTNNQKVIIQNYIECAKILDKIFLLQKYEKNLELMNEIKSLNDKRSENYYRIMQGPFDQFDDNKPYIEGIKYTPHAAFYPDDLTDEEFHDFLKLNQDKKQNFISPYTIIRRDGTKLKAINYSDYYKEYLKEASDILFKTAAICENFTQKNFCTKLGEAFLNNDFIEADIAWLKLDENEIEPLLGPHEFYEDRFLGYKASFTSFVTVKNKIEGKKASMVKKLIDKFQELLPIPEHYKKVKRGEISSIEVVDLLFCGGDGRAPIQTSAFNLPNSHYIRANFGSKKILLYNIMEAKFNAVVDPLSAHFLDEKMAKDVTFAANFNLVLLHEVSHELGINFIKDSDGKLYEIVYFLKDLYSTIEEAKADVMGIYLLLYLIKECYISDCSAPEVANTYVIGLIRSMRFGKENAHGRASIIQWNYLVEEDVIKIGNIEGEKGKNNSIKLIIDLSKFEKIFETILAIILTFQAEGDYDKTKSFIDKYSNIDPVLKNILDEIENLPIDILSYFPLAGEDKNITIL